MSQLKCLLYLTELQGVHLSGKKFQVPNFASKKAENLDKRVFLKIARFGRSQIC